MPYRFIKKPVYAYEDALEMIKACNNVESAESARDVILADKDHYTGREYQSLYELVNRRYAECMMGKGKKGDK